GQAWLEDRHAATAASRTPPWLLSGWGWTHGREPAWAYDCSGYAICRISRLRAQSGSPNARSGLWSKILLLRVEPSPEFALQSPVLRCGCAHGFGAVVWRTRRIAPGH